jgi:hypothetical protein
MNERINSLCKSASLSCNSLDDELLDVVIGGTEGYPGLALGTNINISPWSSGAFNRQWVLVDATGQTPR